MKKQSRDRSNSEAEMHKMLKTVKRGKDSSESDESDSGLD